VPDMDQGIKRLIQTHPADVLALTLPGADYLGTLPVDVAAEPQLALDTLLRVRYKGVECAVDLEAEARARPDMGRRLFEYGARATIVTGLPVISVVLWLEPGGAPPPAPFELRAADRLIAHWHFSGIEVYKLPAEQLIGPGLPGLLPLVPFTADGGDLDTVERAAELVQERAPVGEVGELANLLILFAGRRLDAAVLRVLAGRLHVSYELIRESSVYRDLSAADIARGKAEGIEQGKAEGQSETAREAALLALRGRFGTLPEEIERAVASAPVEALFEVLAHVATDSLEQVRARLGG